MVRAENELVEVERRLTQFVRGPEGGVTGVQRETADDLAAIGVDDEGAPGIYPAFDDAGAAFTLRPLLDSGVSEPSFRVTTERQDGFNVSLLGNPKVVHPNVLH